VDPPLLGRMRGFRPYGVVEVELVPCCVQNHAAEMVTRYGMAETIGARTYAPSPQSFLAGTSANRAEASEATAREIDIAVRDIRSPVLHPKSSAPTFCTSPRKL
jgi:hypothetical protein